ncbi:hypothetical protein PVAND_014183 [Polypedilum vanderplanki]|uniref:G-protein coupled receptors family 2 profile 2 domain-containing protein n=1 Tax=Polypedilum vanderplanki TaxID=319348 RepID=A0A9J6CSU2_POLVA|nr:hypothetical protein PVAND_014183 [Polypedilum vanderplanki]
MTSKLLSFSLLLLFLSESYSETTRQTAASPPNNKKVIISKCCRIGDSLDENGKCIIGAKSKWVPKIFLPKKKAFYEKEGTLLPIMTVKEEVRPDCKYPEFFKSSEVILIGNGSLYLQNKHLTLNNSESFCIDQDYSLVCRFDKDSVPDNMTIIKLTKCCLPNEIYESNKCSSLNKSDQLNNYKIINTEDIKVDYDYKFPECIVSNEFAITGPFSDQNFDFTSGSVTTDSGKIFEHGQYCLDHVIAEDKHYEGIKIFTCSDHYQTAPPPPSRDHHQDDTHFAIYSIGLLISVLFLIATLAVGFLLLSNHHMLHWRCQTNYVICLLIGDLLLAITQIFGTNLPGPACTITAHLMHFFFLATFFWLNTMCFNIWWTFRDFRPTSMEKGQESIRLRIYEVYAWGMPIIITVVAAILDNLPESPTDRFLRPRFGEKSCWFYGDMEIFAYFFGPIGILLCVNILLFLSTARQLTCGLWKRDDVKSTSERTQLGKICLKLVIVMGVTWIIDVISWAVGGPDYIWYVTDVINAMQGVLIFIVVGCQPQVWSALKRFWSSRSGDHRMTGTTNGPQHSISSHGMPSLDASVTNQTTNSKVETMC